MIVNEPYVKCFLQELCCKSTLLWTHPHRPLCRTQPANHGPPWLNYDWYTDALHLHWWEMQDCSPNPHTCSCSCSVSYQKYRSESCVLKDDKLKTSSAPVTSRWIPSPDYCTVPCHITVRRTYITHNFSSYGPLVSLASSNVGLK